MSKTKPKTKTQNKPQNKPLVSVVIPAFNAALTIGRAIESILAQTYQPVEIIIVNDKSTDNTLGIIASYQKNKKQIRIINHAQNLGVGASRQSGVANAQGDYILWQDADDYSPPQRLEILLRYLEKEKNIAAVGSNFYVMRDSHHSPTTNNPRPKMGKPTTPIIDNATPHFLIHFPTLLVRKEFYLTVPYRPLRQGEDADWCYRLLEQGGVIKNLPQPLYYYYKHRSGLTRQQFEKFVFGMMVRLAHELRKKNLPDPFTTLPRITVKNFVLFYDKKIYRAINKNISQEIHWFLLENIRQALTRPWFAYKNIYAIARFVGLAGQPHFLLTAWLLITRLPLNILPYIITRKIIF